MPVAVYGILIWKAFFLCEADVSGRKGQVTSPKLELLDPASVFLSSRMAALFGEAWQRMVISYVSSIYPIIPASHRASFDDYLSPRS